MANSFVKNVTTAGTAERYLSPQLRLEPRKVTLMTSILEMQMLLIHILT